MQSLIDKVERAIDYGLDQERYIASQSYRLRTKLDKRIFDVPGMTVPEVRILLNELVDSETNYLEIGIHRGSTFVSAMYKNNPKSAFAIDHFGGPLFSDVIKKQFIKNCADANITQFKLFHEDSFKLKKEQKDSIKDVNVYFYDGGHTADDHRKSLTYFYDNLASNFILVVDDWVHDPAKEGTRLGIREMNLKIEKEWELGYSQHLRENNPKLSWHNGIYIAVLTK
jgi:hypothetical protein